MSQPLPARDAQALSLMGFQGITLPALFEGQQVEKPLIVPESPLNRALQGVHENNAVAGEVATALANKRIVRFDNEYFDGYELSFLCEAKRGAFVAKSSKPLIYHPTFKGDLHTLVFFPKATHAEKVYMISKFSHRNGPGDHFPGCMMAITYQVDYEKGLAAIVVLQSSINYSDKRISRFLANDNGKSLKKVYKSRAGSIMKLAIKHCQSLGIRQFCLRSEICPALNARRDQPVSETALMETGSFERAGELQVELDDKTCLWNSYSLRN